jgi:hypothetical protein
MFGHKQRTRRSIKSIKVVSLLGQPKKNNRFVIFNFNDHSTFQEKKQQCLHKAI